jgi:hypothetical protein
MTATTTIYKVKYAEYHIYKPDIEHEYYCDSRELAKDYIAYLLKIDTPLHRIKCEQRRVTHNGRR